MFNKTKMKTTTTTQQQEQQQQSSSGIGRMSEWEIGQIQHVAVPLSAGRG
jgi:hypothetical protein